MSKTEKGPFYGPVQEVSIPLGSQRLYVTGAFSQKFAELLESHSSVINSLAPDDKDEVANLFQGLQTTDRRTPQIVESIHHTDIIATALRQLDTPPTWIIGCSLEKPELEHVNTAEKILDHIVGQMGMSEELAAGFSPRVLSDFLAGHENDVVIIITNFDKLPPEEQVKTLNMLHKTGRVPKIIGTSEQIFFDIPPRWKRIIGLA